MSKIETDNLKIDPRIQFVDKQKTPTALELFEKFPHAIILVLDFALKDCDSTNTKDIYSSDGFYIAKKYIDENRILLNIDHHNSLAAQTKNLSTTPQTIKAVKDKIIDPTEPDQIVIINHDDTDSVLSALVATQILTKSTLELFGKAAVAADHTGEYFSLVNLVDTFFGTQNLEQLIPLINSLLKGEDLHFEQEQQREKFERFESHKTIIPMLVQDIISGIESNHGSGGYENQTGILYLQPTDTSIDTIRTFPYTKNLDQPVRIIITYEKIKGPTPWKISVRSGPDFPTQTTLMQLAKELKLDKYGYGGRKNAGGIGRYAGAKIIIPEQIVQKLSDGLRKYL